MSFRSLLRLIRFAHILQMVLWSCSARICCANNRERLWTPPPWFVSGRLPPRRRSGKADDSISKTSNHNMMPPSTLCHISPAPLYWMIRLSPADSIRLLSLMRYVEAMIFHIIWRDCFWDRTPSNNERRRYSQNASDSILVDLHLVSKHNV